MDEMKLHSLNLRREIQMYLVRHAFRHLLATAAVRRLIALWLCGCVLFLVWVPILVLPWTIAAFLAVGGTLAAWLGDERVLQVVVPNRSEERRVGKEARSRGSQ